jgi:ATP-dependent RNA helicase DeaD
VTEAIIPSQLAAALAARDYVDLTPVQSAVLAPAAAGRDLLVSAQTGSGKTVAYGLALVDTLMGDAERLHRTAAPLALVVAPTRELALQVQRELTWLYADTGARIIACVGGMDARRERRLLEDGAHIVVGTPGRLRDHIERGALEPFEAKAVVLDEADEMLDLGFRDDLEFILNATPEDRRTLLFSATIPAAIATLAKRYQRQALRIESGAGERGHQDIDYRVIRVFPNEVEHAVVNVLRQLEPKTAIVFANTRNAVRHLQATLVERGFSAVFLSGELGQHERNLALQSLRDGRARICVATDVAARGIDLPNLALVIHAELPHDAEVMQHRSGRTGRAGNKGVSVLLVPTTRRRRAESLLAEAGIRAEWTGPPTADDIRALDRERIFADPLLTEEASEEDRQVAAVLMERKSAEDIAVALARVLRSRLPEPEEVSDPGFARSATAGPRGRPERDLKMTGDMAWFRADVGRQNRADPKWLLPMICRRGKVTRDDIGAIRIHDTTTEFQVSAALAETFIVNARKANADDVFITPIQEGEGGAPPPRFRQRPDEGRETRDAKPYAKKRPPPGSPKGKAERGGFKHRKNRERQ